jgi:DNA-binding CsgD family transcriptional regulator
MPRHAEALELYEQGLTYRQIGKRMKIRNPGAYLHAARNPERHRERRRQWWAHNAPPPTGRVGIGGSDWWAQEQRTPRLKALWGKGATFQHMADVLGTTRNAVSGKIKRLREAGAL